ncbi:MAG: thiamine phosphate synthase [Selenomonadaceae bacterium]|nr:thiamine phosphate synthase [Selenomonadaceae bacterium]MBQ6758780.1 thiamine phosphate synthase [Selenomonadaceae bacterium]MBR0102472.1 thiamine phosphate synthase [Selenomonadaceae bacterium]
MSIRERLDISAYLVIGQENTTRPVEKVIAAAVSEGFTCVQIRSKVATAREMIDTLGKTAAAIRELGKSDSVALLVDDRLDVVLAARDAGIKVDGVHVGQSDIPVDVCRKYLGAGSIVGLSARTEELIDYVKAADVSQIDYLGAGPLHATETKLDAGKTSDGRFITHGFKELAELVKVSPRPIVVGGGVKLKDIPALAATNVAGFFVVSAVAGADNPRLAARELVEAWRQCH